MSDLNIPDGWKIDALRFCSKVYDGTHQTPEYVDSGVPFYSVEQITADNFCHTKKVSMVHYLQEHKRLYKDKEENKDRKIIEENDILMTRIGSVGASKLIDWDIKSCFYVSVALIKVNNSINPNFLNQFIASDFFQRELWRRTIHVAFPKKINLGEIANCKVLLPPVSEQKAIAHTLQTWDTAIEKTEKLIAAKQRQFGWLINSLMNKDFKEYSNYLSDYAGIMKQQKIEEVGELKPLTVKLHCKGVEANEREVKIALSKKGRPYFQRFTGEFLIGRQNFHNGGFGIVPEQISGFIASNAITTLEIDEMKLDPSYLFYFFSRKDYYLRIGHIMDGTGQKELSDKQIMKLPVSIPNLQKQKEVVELLNTVQQEINLLKKLAEKYRTQKRGLMQKLLTGTWRIKV